MLETGKEDWTYSSVYKLVNCLDIDSGSKSVMDVLIKEALAKDNLLKAEVKEMKRLYLEYKEERTYMIERTIQKEVREIAENVSKAFSGEK